MQCIFLLFVVLNTYLAPYKHIPNLAENFFCFFFKYRIGLIIFLSDLYLLFFFYSSLSLFALLYGFSFSISGVVQHYVFIAFGYSFALSFFLFYCCYYCVSMVVDLIDDANWCEYNKVLFGDFSFYT